jgi:hypothetical protein
LAMNHHNIKEEKDYDYYNRCWRRLETMLKTTTEKVFLHISPVITANTYNENKSDIIKEMIDFDIYMKTKTENIKGMFFILVKESSPSSGEKRCLYKTEEGSEIWKLSVSEGFIDAGENFMGDCNEILSFIENSIKEK